ncbi:MAG: hypothetical protein BAJALOKI1v1_1080014 [Promethearchaeota archaeon]|nr:MAG: hypothetical protein BAJALOKI1v1_1080014 [Candidatus Lokiarchaeota archaeon]
MNRAKVKAQEEGGLLKKLKSICFEYYKQGFLFGHYILNNGLYMSKEQLKSLILEDYKLFFDSHNDEHLSIIQNNTKEPNSYRLTFSDLIKENGKDKSIPHPQLNPNKILTICPLCNKTIYASEIDFEDIDLSKLNSYPFDYVYVHSTEKYPLHALLMYFDAHLNVRGRKVAKFTNIKV